MFRICFSMCMIRSAFAYSYKERENSSSESNPCEIPIDNDVTACSKAFVANFGPASLQYGIGSRAYTHNKYPRGCFFQTQGPHKYVFFNTHVNATGNFSYNTPGGWDEGWLCYDCEDLQNRYNEKGCPCMPTTGQCLEWKTQYSECIQC